MSRSSKHSPSGLGRSAAAPAGPGRLTSLDGLRGLAALIVVVHHCALSLPALAAQQVAPDHGSRAWWLTYTPAHLLWAGGEAVLVFFVLSGLVLALPHLRPARPGTWAPYYAKRAVRLYVPVAVAVGLTGIVVTVVPRVAGPGWSWWMAAHAVPVQLRTLVHDAGLLGGTGWLNSALWSLKYEVFFSLLLPVFVVLVRQLSAPLCASVPFALWGIGWAVSNAHELVSYMFVFAVGVLLAQRLATLRSWGEAINRSPFAAVGWTVFVVTGLLLLLAEWWMKQFVHDWTLWLPVGRPAAVLGAAVLVFGFLGCPLLRAAGDSRPLQWLGKISFSLYLVHEPIVVSVAALTPPGLRGLAVTLTVGLGLSFLAAVVFFRTVERPSQRLAGWVGRLVRSCLPEAAPARSAALPVPASPVVTGPRTQQRARALTPPPPQAGVPASGSPVRSPGGRQSVGV